MSRLERFLIALLVILLGIIVIVGIFLWLRPDEPPPPPVVGIEPTSVIPGQTAQVAYATAQRAATEWQADARLLRATATWPQGSRNEEMLTGEAVWNFTFYSTESGEVVTVTVTEGVSSVVNPRPAQTLLNPADVTGWRIDSNDAVNIAFQEGAEAFLASAGIATLNMDLNTVSENGMIAWLITFLAPQSGDSLIIRLDANGGAVIDIIGP